MATRRMISTIRSRHARAFAERASRCIAPSVIELGKRLDRPIVLVGLMGVGKSTVGRRLARRLGLAFVDSDAAIEDAAGLSPRRSVRALRRAGLSRRRAAAGRAAGGRRRCAGDRHRRRRLRRSADARAAQRTRDHRLARCAGRDAHRAHRSARYATRSSGTAIRRPRSSDSRTNGAPPTRRHTST